MKETRDVQADKQHNMETDNCNSVPQHQLALANEVETITTNNPFDSPEMVSEEQTLHISSEDLPSNRKRKKEKSTEAKKRSSKRSQTHNRAT